MSTATVFAMGGRGGRPEVGPGSSSFSAQPSMSSSGAAAGGAGTPPSNVASVPEIDASTGLLALAAVLAIVAFVWERNRRARA